MQSIYINNNRVREVILNPDKDIIPMEMMFLQIEHNGSKQPVNQPMSSNRLETKIMIPVQECIVLSTTLNNRTLICEIGKRVIGEEKDILVDVEYPDIYGTNEVMRFIRSLKNKRIFSYLTFELPHWNYPT